MTTNDNYRYQKVIAVVGMNPNKEYDVAPHKRAQLINKMMSENSAVNHGTTDNVSAEVVSGYIWRFGKARNVSILFRGIRSWEKDGREERALHFLNSFGPISHGPFVWPIPTIFLEGNPEYNHVSSTLIRKLCKNVRIQNNSDTTKCLKGLVPDSIAVDIAEEYGSSC